VTSVSGPLQTAFQANDASLTQTHAINWSVGIERKLPGSIYAGISPMHFSSGAIYSCSFSNMSARFFISW
jgi:hypothetical protein